MRRGISPDPSQAMNAGKSSPPAKEAVFVEMMPSELIKDAAIDFDLRCPKREMRMWLKVSL